MGASVHGGQLDRAARRYGGNREDWLDLSTGINPVAYPVEDIPGSIWQRLPDDRLLEECIAAAADYYGVPDGAGIIAGPGSQSIIQRAGSDRRGIVWPTYGGYLDACESEFDPAWKIARVPENFDEYDTIIACHPNNPDGRLLDTDRLLNLLDNATPGQNVVIVDEAFGDVTPDESFVRFSDHPCLIVLRSFGKFFGLAGLRLGFAIGGGRELCDLCAALGSWAVAGPALFIGAKALRDGEWINDTRQRLKRDAVCLRSLLAKAGLEVVGTTDLFVLAKNDSAAQIAESLASQRVLVRSFDYDAKWLRFGLPANGSEFERLGHALEAALNNAS